MFLGIDLGTSALKLLLLDAQHHIIATEGEALSVQRPQPLWSEQSPATWWAATEAAMDRLAARHPRELAQVQGIGLSGQMHGAVLLNEAAGVLRPAMLWNDGRSAAQCAALEAACPDLHRLAGNLAMPGFTAPKLLWVREHEAEVFARTARVLLPKDWLRLQLTGEAVSDMSDASGTLWLDVGARRWSPTLLAATGLDEAQMPRLVEGSAVSGTLRGPLARRWGLPDGVVVAGGAGDNAASAVGMGAVRPGQGFVSLGTSGVVFLSSEQFRPRPEAAVHAFCHALPQTWHQMSVMLSAASALRWARELMGLASEAELMARVAALTAAQRARAPLFLPYLSGERTPHNHPQAQGVLFGLSAAHDAASVGYAVMEGVSFGLQDGWHSLQSPPGGVTGLSLVGGGARSALWAQHLASTLGLPLWTHHGGEAGGALGAARLAWLAGGGRVDQVCLTPPVQATYVPDPAQAEALAERRPRWQRLYPLLREEFDAG
jgi:xylulokinase